jgi:hypothetical protein
MVGTAVMVGTAQRRAARHAACRCCQPPVCCQLTVCWHCCIAVVDRQCAGRWEWWKRAARHGARSFGHSLHISLAVMLVGGAVMFEYSHSALWAARNKGVSHGSMRTASFLWTGRATGMVLYHQDEG